jgi:hypothetical protein
MSCPEGYPEKYEKGTREHAFERGREATSMELRRRLDELSTHIASIGAHPLDALPFAEAEFKNYFDKSEVWWQRTWGPVQGAFNDFGPVTRSTDVAPLLDTVLSVWWVAGNSGPG